MVTLNIVRDKPSVVVLTPTTGAECLIDAMSSVQLQDYSGLLEHHIVIDGAEYNTNFYRVQTKFTSNYPKALRTFKTTWLTDNVGKGGFYGHRIYAAFPHLLNYDYIFFLDQDAAYKQTHISTMVQSMLDSNWDWAYSLRNIYDRDNKFVCADNCESLGEWPAFMNESVNLVDTSCYGFSRQFLINTCTHWHFGWGGDRRFFEIVTKHLKHTNFGTTGKHTVNYRLGGNENSPKSDMFLGGNIKMEQKYGTNFPWHNKSKP